MRWSSRLEKSISCGANPTFRAEIKNIKNNNYENNKENKTKTMK